METVLQGVLDNNLRFTLAFGIGLHHAGLHEKDRKTVEELFVNQKIQVDALTNQSTDQSIDQSVNQSINQSIIYRSVKISVNLSVQKCCVEMILE